MRSSRQSNSCVWFALLIGMSFALPDIPLWGEEMPAETPIDFVGDVAPILEQNCLRCHSPGIRKGDLSLDAANEILELGYLLPGNADGSYLVEVVTPDGQGEAAMPAEGQPLDKEQIETLRRWIATGAAWPEEVVLREPSAADKSWWSLQPLREKRPELDIGTEWCDNPIDEFVLSKLQEVELTPSEPADSRTLLRRATFDAIGMPPTPEQVAEFTRDDRPDAYLRRVDRLLASPHYGQQWGRHWLDVVRFGESIGFERNEIINNLWPFRDYVIESFNADKPFDDFIREHLAGDAIGADEPSVEIGSAFLVAGPYDDVGNQDAEQAAQIRANTIDEMIRATSGAFLGLTVGCARCHDHKFDPILQSDYYGMYAAFAGVRHGSRVAATDAEQAARETELRPFQEEKEALERKRDELLERILARATAREDEIVEHWTREPISRRGVEERFSPADANYVRLVVEGQEQNPRARTGYRIDEFEVYAAGDDATNIALASQGAKASGASRVADDFAGAYGAELTIDGRFGAHWIASGPTLTIELPRPTAVARIFFSSDRGGAAGDHDVANFVSEYRIEVSLDGEAWTQVADSYERAPVNDAHRRKRLIDAEIRDSEKKRRNDLTKRIAEINLHIDEIPELPVWWLGSRVDAPGPFHVFIGGSPQRLGEEIAPASLSTLDAVAPTYELPQNAGEAARRLALANWIVDSENPLPQRVLANRLWHYHFGAGLCNTPNDLGYMGATPSHPELLDYLAGELLRREWRIKPLHRLIMTSATYRQASTHRPSAAAVDGDSRLLWRFPPLRLAAEEIRDAILFTTGRINLRFGGPGFRLYHYMQDNVSTYVPLAEHGPETYRRAVYHQNARAAPVDLMAEFDQPDCAFSAPRRAATTTPVQALTMLNHAFTLDMADALAERIEREAGEGETIARAFELCFCRGPTIEERRRSQEFVDKHGLTALCRVLLNTSEFIYVE